MNKNKEHHISIQQRTEKKRITLINNDTYKEDLDENYVRHLILRQRLKQTDFHKNYSENWIRN